MKNHSTDPKTRFPTRVAVDTGGTFTDFFVLDPHGIRTHKVLSTPADPSRAILRGLKELSLEGNFTLIHGSTVATNALLEHKGANVALITTADFEDILEIGRQNREKLYDLNLQPTPPLVSSRLRFGIRERMDSKGSVETPLEPAEIRRLLHRLRRSSADSVSVCLLFAYANPNHERAVAAALKTSKKFVSISSRICPEFREYERCSTTCVNAYVTPVMSRYLGRLQRKVVGNVRVMQSNGGNLSVPEASQEAVRTLLSGPAGGALGALQIARQAGFHRILTLDMGGTSTDMSLIDGELELTSEARIGGYPVKTPMIRIDTIGAGGGSIAWIDAGGALRVGPESAGARPGPICYGRGGDSPTLTDAHVRLGRIPPKYFLGGTMPLFPEKIQKPFRKFSRLLKLPEMDTADGMIQVANSGMARSLRVLSLERGYDPREFTLMPFGGAGALHACELADLLGVPRVLVPSHPGLLSAFGMAIADWVRDAVQTVLLKEEKATASELKRRFAPLEKKVLSDARREGLKKKRLHLKAEIDVRYQGQSHELRIEAGPDLRGRFERAHHRHYGYIHARRPIEIVNLRLQARVRSGLKPPPPRQVGREERIRPVEKVQLYWRKKYHSASVFRRETLEPEGGANGRSPLRGPLIVVEYSATTLVPPGWKAECDELRNLILTPW
jgi:N-methylhydantoinase A